MKFVIILCLVGLVACQNRGHNRRPSSRRQGFRGFGPPQQNFRGFRPQKQGFRPQQQGFRPQQQGFRPQQQSFRPQQQGFRPQQQSFRPQQQGFRQPQNTGFRPQQFTSPQNNVRSLTSQRSSANNVRSGGSQVDDSHGGSEYHFSWLHDGGQKYDGHAAHSYCSGLGGGWTAVGISDHSEGGYINDIVARQRQKYIWTGGEKTNNGWKWLNNERFSYSDWSSTGGAQIPQPDNRERGGEPCLAILNNFYQDGVKWHDVACHHTKPVICERRA